MSETPGNPSTFRVGLIGFGRIARDYVRAVHEIPELEIAAVAELDDGVREVAASELSVPTYANTEQMVTDQELDVGFVLTPPSTHEAIVIRMLQGGCHVLCEKPLAIGSEGAHHMLVAAQRAQRSLTMATKFRFVEDVVEARRLIAAGAIGTPVFYDNTFCSVIDMTDRWNSRPDVSGGGVMIDSGAHAADLARCMVGNIVKVFATFGRRVQPLQVEDSVRIQFEAFGGVMGSIELSWSMDKHADHYVVVTGSEGTLQIGWKQSRYRRIDEDEWQVFGDGYDKGRAFKRQLEHLVATVKGDEEPLVTREDMHDSVRFVESSYSSAMSSKWVPVAPHRNR